jgi:DNA polymerase III subunit epsilon
MNATFQYSQNDTPLGLLEVLAVDCQASAANPDTAHLLEIGYMAGSAARPIDIDTARSHIIRQPEGVAIPPHVLKITGISEADLICGIADSQAWQMLLDAAQRVAARNQSSRCPAIIHYARFEHPFLCRLHRENAPGSPFALDIICTHYIAQRLLPGLPRKGIRALAGHFGHCAPILKRSAGHAVATMAIWRHIVALLVERCNITTYGQLQDWMAHTPHPGRVERVFPMPAAIRQALADKPGVYRMRSLGGDLLYIGKAKSLKKRVASYFRRKAPHPEHILEMLSQTRKIDFSLTESALEAAILETDEIKEHRPPYNKALQPNQRSLIFVSRDFRQQGPHSDHQLCIGPLPDGRIADSLSALGAWLANRKALRGEDLLEMGCPLLARSVDRLPNVQCMEEGFDLFCMIHRVELESRTPLRVVTAVGAKLWRERLNTITAIEPEADLQSEGVDDSEPATEAAGGEGDWSPEKITATIEGMIMHSAHLIRRGRWYCLLSESSLAWAADKNPQQLEHLVVFEHGCVHRRSVLQVGQTVPAPPGLGRSWMNRRNDFDLAAYDRMRVVTTELRRIGGKGRKIQLRLGRKATLSASDLQKALRWV